MPIITPCHDRRIPSELLLARVPMIAIDRRLNPGNTNPSKSQYNQSMGCNGQTSDDACIDGSQDATRRKINSVKATGDAS